MIETVLSLLFLIVMTIACGITIILNNIDEFIDYLINKQNR